MVNAGPSSGETRDVADQMVVHWAIHVRKVSPSSINSFAKFSRQISPRKHSEPWDPVAPHFEK